ncbi:galactose mutarotase [Sphingomonas ginkgonis]|uniref:Aldose 1-epimerase n=1 Tax=Sphingomonas ginkgonis TaxID=2315330 RepID=A0A3R9Z734_9SPHN|nr:aldose epimerase family protein [Sphingomonas ginkgonis]RST31433.1 galactose mutarotase [Sphingomonas ginkgonis]
MRHSITGALLAAAVSLPGAASAATVSRAPFGTLPDGSRVEIVTLTGANGVRARIMTYGATLQALEVPDRAGRRADVELGYDRLDDYVTHPNFWGQTIGRYANRIAGGRFSLDGRSYQLPLNDKTNSLHGGTQGFDKRNWRITDTGNRDGAASVTMTLVSPAGDQGYPGTLTATATYSLDDRGSLTIDYGATTDAPTIVNMTNHAIFNLGGEGAPGGILRHRMTIPARRYTPVNAQLIPTGELKPVAGTVFDFTRARTIEDGIRDGRDPQIVAGRGYDHNFAIDAGLTTAPKLMVHLEDPMSGRTLDVLSDQPGLQVYTGNFLDGTLVGKGGHVYRMGDGIALEPQRFPDTPNQPAFGSARLNPGQTYHHRMIFRVSTVR